MKRRIVLPLAAFAFVSAAAGVTWATAGGDGGTGDGREGLPAAATTTVVRRNLVQHETVDGTLGYADRRTVYAHGAGTVTGLPSPGVTVSRGQALYRVDGRPVTLLYGQVPAWRRLDRTSADGPDIRQLEANLVALGYDPYGKVEVDDDWDTATEAAVKRWQADGGVKETGAVDPGEIVFLPGPRRVGQAQTAPGAIVQPGTAVLDTTSLRRSVAVDLDADLQSLVRPRDSVTVDLPDGRSVPGTITTVGRVAETETNPQTGERSDPTIRLTIRLASRARTGDLDEAPVAVHIARARAQDVLAVPVSALLALVEGGYAVETVSASGAIQLVRVKTGMFADGLVEVSGRTLRRGTTVVVPT